MKHEGSNKIESEMRKVAEGRIRETKRNRYNNEAQRKERESITPPAAPPNKLNQSIFTLN